MTNYIKLLEGELHCEESTIAQSKEQLLVYYRKNARLQEAIAAAEARRRTRLQQPHRNNPELQALDQVLAEQRYPEAVRDTRWTHAAIPDRDLS